MAAAEAEASTLSSLIRRSEADHPPAASSPSFVHLLRGLANVKDLQSGILVHDHIVARGLESDPFISDHLVHLYVACDSLTRAQRVFDHHPRPGLLSWNRMISAYSKRRPFKHAIHLFRRMQLQGVAPDRKTFVAVIRACGGWTNFNTGKWIHSLASESGFDSCVVVCTALIAMYSDCGSLTQAIRVFRRMPKRDVFAWTAMIAAFERYGYLRKVMLFYRRMLLDGFLPTAITFAAILKALAGRRDWIQGRWIHLQITQMGLESDLLVATRLITLFGRCGDMKKARRVFRKLHRRDAGAYNALLQSHIENDDGVDPDKTTVLAALSCCVRSLDLEVGKDIHVSVINQELESDLEVANALIQMYVRCGSLRDAEWMFQRMARPNLVSWSALIAAFVADDRCEEALSLFRRMQLEGVFPDRTVLAEALRACGSLEKLDEGRRIHQRIVVQSGLDEDEGMKQEVLSMYCRCKSLDEACVVFELVKQPEVVSWNLMMEAYVKRGYEDLAVGMLRAMLLEGVRGNRRSFCIALAACWSLEEINWIHKGLLIHRRGYVSSLVVGNALLSAYRNFGGSIEDAEMVLSGMSQRDAETWSSMFAICGRSPCTAVASKLFREMMLDGIKPSRATFSLLLNACGGGDEGDGGNTYHLRFAKFVHSCVSECDEFESDAVVSSCLLSLYSRCGSLEDACAVFNKTHLLGVAVWNEMITAFADNGYPQNAFFLFQRMAREGLAPDEATVAEVLRACAQIEALKEGKLVHSECVELGFELDVGVGTELVNLYGKCRCVYHAEDVFCRMQHKSVATWKCMISVYLLNGFSQDAQRLLHVMQIQGFAREIELSILWQLDMPPI